MGDTAGHLAQRAQPLLLHHGLLRLAQVVISLLQSGANLRLVGRQRNVLAQLPEKLAVSAAEAIRFAARGDENSEHLAFHQQGRGYQGAQAAAREPLRKGELQLADVRLIHQLAAHAAGEAVLVDGDPGLLGHGQIHRQRLAADAHPTDGEHFGRLIVEADTSEIDGQAIFQAADHHLKNAGQVLPLADGARNLIEEVQPFDLSPEPAVRPAYDR